MIACALGEFHNASIRELAPSCATSHARCHDSPIHKFAIAPSILAQIGLQYTCFNGVCRALRHRFLTTAEGALPHNRISLRTRHTSWVLKASLKFPRIWYIVRATRPRRMSLITCITNFCPYFTGSSTPCVSTRRAAPRNGR